MSSESERIERAGDYIMGRMSDAERERAERDLERDPKFRETVIRLAERLRSSAPANRDQADLWNSVQEGIAGLPQMRDAPLVQAREASSRREGEAGSVVPLAGWRGAAAIAALAAAAGAGFLAGDLMSGADDPVALVRLSDANGALAGILEISGDDSLRFLPLDLIRPRDGQVLNVWTTGVENGDRVLLGSIGGGAPLRWRGPDLPPPRAGQSYSIVAASSADAASGWAGGEMLYEGRAVSLSGD